MRHNGSGVDAALDPSRNGREYTRIVGATAGVAGALAEGGEALSFDGADDYARPSPSPSSRV